ncbi:MAG: hypothetical protein LBM78_02400 [Clostridiales bacterium]|nr:hypothetical protein [Clostridiales bacterium]
MRIAYRELIESSGAYGQFSHELRGGGYHAYLFVSDDRVAKESLKLMLSAAVLCRRADAPCFECAECRKALSGNHADLHLYVPEKNIITVDMIKALVADAPVASYEGGKRLYLVDYAETLTEAAQNKLLKTLEEPPADAILILIASNEVALLPTVRSRVRTLRLLPFAEDALVRALSGFESARRTAALLSGGSLTRAERILTSPQYADMDELAFSVLLTLRGSAEVPACAEKVLRYKDKLQEFFALMVRITGQSARLILTGACEGLSERQKCDILSVKEDFNAEGFGCILQAIARASDRLEGYGNPPSVVDELLFTIAEVRATCRR